MLRLVLQFIANLGALYFANEFIDGVVLEMGFIDILLLALTLTAINIFVKPILKLLLGPIIVITLGLGLFVVNAVIIMILDYLFVGVTITGLLPLVYMTLIVSAFGIIAGMMTKSNR